MICGNAASTWHLGIISLSPHGGHSSGEFAPRPCGTGRQPLRANQGSASRGVRHSDRAGRSIGAQVMVERAGGDVSEFAADVRNRACPGGHEVLDVAQLLAGHDARASALAATRPSGLHTLADALADDVSLHLRERRLYLQEGPSRRCGGVHRRVDRAEPDTALVELVDQGDELAGAAPQPIEDQNDEDIALAQIVEAVRFGRSDAAPEA